MDPPEREEKGRVVGMIRERLMEDNWSTMKVGDARGIGGLTYC